MTEKKVAIQQGNKFVLERQQISFEEEVAKAINAIEAKLGLPITNLKDLIKK